MLGAVSLPATLLTVQPPVGITTTFPDDASVTHLTDSSGTVAGFSIVSTGGAAVYPYQDFFDLGDNGTWNDGLIGDASGVTVLTVSLGGLYSSAGGFVNYHSPTEPGANPPFIAALDAGMNLLESYDLSGSINTGAGSLNAREFRGIDLGAPVIAYLQFGGSGMVMHDITLEAVPEPSTVWMAVLGLSTLPLLAQRRRRFLQRLLLLLLALDPHAVETAVHKDH